MMSDQERKTTQESTDEQMKKLVWMKVMSDLNNSQHDRTLELVPMLLNMYEKRVQAHISTLENTIQSRDENLHKALNTIKDTLQPIFQGVVAAKLNKYLNQDEAKAKFEEAMKEKKDELDSELELQKIKKNAGIV